MLERFWITYEVEQVDCDVSVTERGLPFLLNVVIETAVIGYGQQRETIPSCALLQLSSSLLALVTFPAMYQIDGFAHPIGTEFDFRSHLDNDNVVLTIFHSHAQRLSFTVPITLALRTVGTFHREILSKWLKACPTLWDRGVLLALERIPDAFALSLRLGTNL